jgi:hypothetical protein
MLYIAYNKSIYINLSFKGIGEGGSKMRMKRYRHNHRREWDEEDIYSSGSADAMLEDDDITPEEAAFMRGYEED